MPDAKTAENPYQPIDDAPKGSIECPFEGVVTASDLANSQRGTRALGTLVMVPLSLFFMWAGVGAFQRGAGESGAFLTSAGAGVVYLLWRLWRSPQRFAKTHPHLFGGRKGKLTTDFIEVQTDTAFHQVRSECILIHGVRNEFISLRVGTDLLLTPGLFAEYSNACELAAEIKRTAVPLDFGDERLLQPVPPAPEEIPAEAILLKGQQFSSDFRIAEMAKGASKLRWFVARKVLVAVLVNTLVLLITRNILLASPTIVLSLVWLYKRVLKPVSGSLKAASMVRNEQDRPVSSVEGWVSDTELYFRSAASRSIYRWDTFERYRMKDEQTVALIMERNALMCSINRRLLTDDSDWTRLMEIVREKLPEAT